MAVLTERDVRTCSLQQRKIIILHELVMSKNKTVNTVTNIVCF